MFLVHTTTTVTVTATTTITARSTDMQEGQDAIQNVEEDVLHEGPGVRGVGHLALGWGCLEQHGYLVRVARQVVDQLVDVTRGRVDKVPHRSEVKVVSMWVRGWVVGWVERVSE